MYQKGMFPNTKLNADNFSLNASYNITSKLTIDGSINFNKQYTPNIPDVSYGPNSYIYMFKVYGSADYDVRDLEDIYKGPMGVPGLVQYAQEYGRLNNPWFMAQKWLRGHDKTDIYAYLRLNYKITSDLNLSLRSQVSTWNQQRTEQVPSSANLNAYTSWYKFGWYGDYREDDRKLFENNTDLQLNYNKTFGKWSVSGLTLVRLPIIHSTVLHVLWLYLTCTYCQTQCRHHFHIPGIQKCRFIAVTTRLISVSINTLTSTPPVVLINYQHLPMAMIPSSILQPQYHQQYLIM
jgi:hypothetical protein